MSKDFNLLRIPTYTDLAILPDMLFWHRDLVVGSCLAMNFAQSFFASYLKRYSGSFEARILLGG